MTTQTAAPKNTTKFGKGNPGKPKGATTKVTREIKEMILEALDKAGGVAYLTKRANDPKTAAAFLGLVGKVLPLQVTGNDGGPLVVELVRFGSEK
jgi:hypothetical protein